jgi:PAS domain S-box-containing protein
MTDAAAPLTPAPSFFSDADVLSRLIKLLPIPLVISEKDSGQFLFANGAALDLVDVTSEELFRTRTHQFFVEQADRSRLIDQLQREETVNDFMTCLRTPHGRVVWVLMSARRLRVGGEPVNIAAFQDVTERKAAQETIIRLLKEIRASNAELEMRVAARTRQLSAEVAERRAVETRLRDAIGALNDGFVLYDAEDRLVLFNSKYRDDYSFAPDLMIPGTPFVDIIRAGVARGQVPRGYDPEKWVEERLARHRNPGPPYLVQRPDRRWVLMTEYRTQEGGIVSLRTDVTNLKRRTQQLKESRRLLRAVIDAVPAIINVKDRQSRYVLMNKFQGDVYGVAPEAAIGKTSADFVGKTYGAESGRLDQAVVATGRPLPFTEREFTDINGVPHVWFTAKMPLKNDAGNVENVVTVALDITTLKTTERARANLARYFAPNMVDELAAADEPFGPPRSQKIAVMFADIVGFTRLCEEQPAEAIFDLLREFQRRMVRQVFATQGTLDKYTGDGMMATFGTPRPSPRDATNALRCARLMLADIAAWNRARRDAGDIAIRVAIGLHHGPALLGNIGDARRLEFAVVGDTVNVASRLQELARPLEAGLVVSEDLLAAVARERVAEAADIDGFVPQPPQMIRGRDNAVPVRILPLDR